MEVLLRDGTILCVSDSLESISTWVALEQEDWFERDLAFLRTICKPDWNVIDIGANHGIYALALAHRGVAHIWAFEPTSKPLACFEESIKRNALSACISVFKYAVSDSNRTGKMCLSNHSELSAVARNVPSGKGENYEDVEFVSMDWFARAHSVPKIDFVKLDAEGEEALVLKGGEDFFADHSPLVLFEFREGHRLNFELINHFRAIGYEIYVLVPALSCLRPLAAGMERFIDQYVINLYACKRDRAELLLQEGVMIRADSPLRVSEGVLSELGALLSMPFIDHQQRQQWQHFDYSTHYGRALLAWCASKNAARSLDERYALLLDAQQNLVEAVNQEDFHPAVTLLLTRVLDDLGQQKDAFMVATALLEQIDASDIPLDRPVSPVLASFDLRTVQSSTAQFIYESVLEYHIYRAAYGGYVKEVESKKYFEAAMRNPERSAELERRVVLKTASGSKFSSAKGLRWLFGEKENRNKKIWERLATHYGYYPYDGDSTSDELLKQGDEAFESAAYEAAWRCYRQAADLLPDSAELHLKAGLSLMRSEKLPEAAECFRKAIELRRGFWPACNNLGLVLVRLRDLQGAENAYRAGLADNPECFDLIFNLASLLKNSGRSAEALYYLRAAQRIRPDFACIYDLIGSVLILMSRTLEAIPEIEKALELDPQWGQAWNNLGRCHFIRGDLDQAEHCYREATVCSPEFLPAWTNRVMTLNYRSNDPANVFDLHRLYGEVARKVSGGVSPSRWRVKNDKTRRLRVGFVSGDFRRHSVSYFIEGVLRHLDRSKFQLYAYFSHDHPDQRTAEFKPLFSLWRDVKDLSDKELAQRIVDDKIDILIDLIGHTTGTRLGVFAEKPAPIQATWIGYPNTTGLDSIDYRLTDGIVDPVGQVDAHCTEKLWRLPRPFLCYSPPIATPDVGVLPLREKGFVTFGSFNSRFKLGDETLSLWSNVLKACPGSRLLLKSPVGLADREARDALREKFVSLGIEASRIDVFEGIVDASGHLDLYNSVDIALDPFPYHGTTTTCEALWMGVPVVTLAGHTHASRVGVSILHHLDLRELIASSADEYVKIAVSLAEDISRLGSLRGNLRSMLLSSPLLDARGMAESVGEAFGEMWTVFCDSADAETVLDQSGLVGATPAMKLHIGGREPRPGWKILNAIPGAHVDIVTDIRDLSQLEEESCSEIYCSHVLEHVGQGDVLHVLESFYRLLMPGGRLSLAVPDLDVLAWLFVNPQFTKQTKFKVMRCMFGGQHDEFDFHQIGLNFDFLRDYLQEVGFSHIEHVESLDIFDDASAHTAFNGVPVSLNLVARK